MNTDNKLELHIMVEYTSCPTQNSGPISSAVLTFIGYKQTNRQTGKVDAQFIARK